MVHAQALSRGRSDDAEEPARHADREAANELSLRLFLAGLGLVLLVQLAVVTYLVRRSYFFAEDFTFLTIYRETPVTGDLLRTSIFGHLVPGFILVQKYFGDWFGANWTLAAIATVAVQLGGTVAFARMLLALVGRRTWWILWLTAAFGLSVVVLNTAPWWAATWTMQITLAAAVSAWGCALRYERTGNWRYLVSLAVMYLVSVAFFEKAIVTSAYLGLFVLFVGSHDGDGWAERFRRALRMWPVWAVIAVITLADLVVYASGPYLSEAGEPAGLGVTAEYLARALPEGTFPTLIGSVYPVSNIPGPDALTVVVATLVALAVVFWTSVRSRLAARAWVWYFVVTLVSQGVIARGRLTTFDIDIVLHNLRYQADTVYLFLIALAVALPAALRSAGPVLRQRAVVAAAVAPLLALPLWIQSVHTISEQSPGRPSRDYFAALRTDDVPEDAVFLELPVSPWVIPAPMYPWNMASKVFPVVRPGTKVTHDPDGALRITDDGDVVPVRLTDLTTPTTEEVCASPGGAGQTLLTLPQQDHPAGTPLMLAVAYETTGRARIQLAVGSGAGDQEIRGTGALFRVAGSGELVTNIAPPEWDTVSVTAAEGREVCITSVRLVALVS